MELKDFLQWVEEKKTIEAESDAMRFCGEMMQRALQLTARINGEYHPPTDLRKLFSTLMGTELNENVYITPPFHTDFGLNIHIGKNVFINAGCNFQDQGGIFIHDHALIGHNVVLATLNHDLAPSRRADVLPSPIVIGSRAWIGANATILPGVSIGEGAVVAAGAVVSRDVPANTVVAGIPAKFVKYIGEEQEER